MKQAYLCLMVIIGVFAILGCVSNNVNMTQNNTTSNITSNFPNVGGNLSIDAGNYNDSYGLTAAEKLDAIKIALNSPGQIQSHIQISGGVDVGNVLPANNSEKPVWFDSGFQNTSDEILSVPITTAVNFNHTINRTIMYFGASFVMFVDVSKGKVMGTDIVDTRGGDYSTETDLPGNSYFYHQLMGTTWIGREYNTTRISLTVITNASDIDAIYPLILDKENFERFRNGSRYEALQYTDYMTNQTMLIDGKSPLRPQNEWNDSAMWSANISISFWSPAVQMPMDRPTNYYIVLQNKANRTIPIIYRGQTVERYNFP